MKIPWIDKNRRKFERIRVLVPCKLVAGDRVFLGKTYDIGLGGARFDAGLEPDMPDQILEEFGELHLLLPQTEIVLHTKILRAASTFVALQFSADNPKETLLALEEFLETQVSYLNL